MHALILAISLGGLAALLVVAAWGDIRHFIIPNRLNAAIALVAPLYWWGAQFGAADIALQIVLAIVVFALFACAFAAGVMGGGDVKMLAALALWLRPDQLAAMLVAMSLAGGMLTVALVARHRLRHRPGKPEIPYGVAISIGACLLFYEPILNQFG